MKLRSKRGAGRCWQAACLLLALLLGACLPAPTPAATPTPSPTATITPTITETVVWFPPTPTYTALPTREPEPTIDTRPALDGVLFRDRFTDTELWQTSRTQAGSVAYGKGELTLAVAEPRGSLVSLRKEPQLRNFYLEVDVQPSLCRSGDTYGLLLRARSGEDYYRLLLDCGGRVRLERIVSGRNTPLHDWISSGQLLPGGLLNTRIGVTARGQELSIFINGVHQFSVKDPVYETGAVGIFARSGGDTPLTVNFSDMVVYELGTEPARTPTPEPERTSQP